MFSATTLQLIVQEHCQGRCTLVIVEDAIFYPKNAEPLVQMS